MQKLESGFGIRCNVSDIDLEHRLKEFYGSQPISRLATKDDVAVIVNKAFATLDIGATYQAADFYTLAQNADATLMFDCWKQLVAFLSRQTV